MLRKLFARPKPIGAQRAHWARPKIEPGYGSSYQCEISEGTEFFNQLMNTNKGEEVISFFYGLTVSPRRLQYACIITVHLNQRTYMFIPMIN